MALKKVITYGTFDLFHDGHYNILKRAKEYGDYLVVGVTGENYDIGRGKLSVYDSLADRIDNVKKTGFADEIIVEEYLGQKIGDIVRYGIDTFVIGDDWRGKFDHLSRYCNMVYLERTAGVSSTQIRQEKLESYRIGIIVDTLDDNTIVSEAEQLNGFKVVSVFAEDESVKNAFQEEYSISQTAGSVDQLFEQTDIVYIRCALNYRSDYIRKALVAGKHVICDPPFTVSGKEHEELLKLAADNNLILMDNVKMVHIHVFNQLLWMTQGGLIGEILSLNISVSRNDRSKTDLFYDLLALALCPMIKILGNNYKQMDVKTVKEDGVIQFASLDFKYDTTRAIINVGNKIRTKSRIEIIGSKGTIRMDDNWWRGNYFELENPDADEIEIYNTNYQGNGFKYLLKAVATMLDNERTKPMGLFPDESHEIVRIAEEVERLAETYQ